MKKHNEEYKPLTGWKAEPKVSDLMKDRDAADAECCEGEEEL